MNALNYALWMLEKGYLRIDGDGRIWRTAEIRHGAWVSIPERRAECESGKGYLRLTLQLPEKRLQSVQAHIVAWVHRHGPIPPGLQVNHKDLNRQNNRDNNLELLTQSGNIRHSYANGRTAPWSHAREWRPGRPRISTETKTQILNERAKGVTLATIAANFGISITHASRLAKREEVGK